MPIELPFVSRKKYNELVYKLDGLFCHITGGRYAKATYSLENMCIVADAHIDHRIDAEVLEHVLTHIRNMKATVLVDVVRCKDCFYAHFNTSSERYSCQREYPRRSVEEDDYCRYGKRSEENEG